MNQEFLARMNGSAKIHLTPARVKGKYVIRFVANQENCSEEQVENAWKMIKEFATEILEEIASKRVKPAGGAQKWKMSFNYLKGGLIVFAKISVLNSPLIKIPLEVRLYLANMSQGVWFSCVTSTINKQYYVA